MTAAEVAARLDARRNGSGWSARCPAHNDLHPSLTISEGANCRVLLHCHAQQCAPAAILAPLGLELRDIMGIHPAKPNKARRRIVATYDYRNEQDELLYQVVRYEPKAFSQRRPRGNDDWVWDLKDTRRVIYSLATLRQRISNATLRLEQQLPGDVFIVEGEKDADRLSAHGLLATSNIGGAGKWRPEYTQQLITAGAVSVAIIPDNDEAGRRHAQDVARSCHVAGLVVKIIGLSDVPEKGDVSDFLDMEHAGDRLKALVALVTGAEALRPAYSQVTAVDLSGLLDKLQSFIHKYVVVEPQHAIAVALWTAHTHTLDAADCTPYLRIESSTKRAGKTRLLEVLEPLVAHPWLTGRTTAAALVRKLDADCPTLLLDESDAAFKGEPEYAEALRGILNSGYKRNGKATLCVGKGGAISVKDFSTFGAKAIAGIGKLPDTIVDRAIQILLRRRRDSEPVARWRDRDGRAEAAPLHAELATWAGEEGVLEQLRAARPDLPQLTDRAADVWEPLLAIADLAGGPWPDRARSAAVALAGAVEDTDPIVELLADIAKVLTANTGTVVHTSVLIEQLTAEEDRPWGTWRNGDKPITPRGLARLLGPLGIHPDRHNHGQERVRGYRTDAFEDAFSRYLPFHVAKRPNPNKNGQERPDTCDSSEAAEDVSVPRSWLDFIEPGTHGHVVSRDEAQDLQADCPADDVWGLS